MNLAVLLWKHRTSAKLLPLASMPIFRISTGVFGS